MSETTELVQQEAKQEVKPVKHYFTSAAPSMVYIFPNGKPAIFQRGTFVTTVAAEADHLDNEIALGHPHIRRMEQQAIVEYETTPADIVAAMRDIIIAEFLEAAQKASGNVNRDMGDYKAGPVKPASSLDVAVAMAGGSGAPVISQESLALAQKLVALRGNVVQAKQTAIEQTVQAIGSPAPAVPGMMDLMPKFDPTVIQGDDNGPKLTELIK